MTSTEDRHGNDRTRILAGDKELASEALKGNRPMMTAFVATIASILYGWNDPEFISEISENQTVEHEVLNIEFGKYSTAAPDLLGAVEYKGNDPTILHLIHGKLTYYQKNQVVG